MAYGNKRDYRKIDLFLKNSGVYLASTTWAKNLKVAREKAAEQFGCAPDQLRAEYAK